MATLSANLPDSYHGQSLRAGHLAGAGLAPDNLQAFLTRTIGIDHAPRDPVEWLKIPEEDIIHIVNGEVWSDPLGEFSRIRQVFQGYYPEPVRLRRIANWCRFFSGMGTYALKRAILRDNEFYAVTRFSNAIRLGIQLAFCSTNNISPMISGSSRFSNACRAWVPRCCHWSTKRYSSQRVGSASSICSTRSPTCSTKRWSPTALSSHTPTLPFAHLRLPADGTRLCGDYSGLTQRSKPSCPSGIKFTWKNSTAALSPN